MKTLEEIKYLLTSFNQVRTDEKISEYSTYPNTIIVFEKDSGTMRLMGTDMNEIDGDEHHDCFTIDKGSDSLKQFLKKCERFTEHGNVYMIELWKTNKKQDMIFNYELFEYFNQKPEIMFEKVKLD